MKNTHKDEYEHKLHRFLKELDSIPFTDFDGYERKKAELYKKYGFTNKDWGKAIYKTMSISNKNCNWDGIGYKKDVQINKDRVSNRLERELASGKQDHLDKVGEAEIKEEDRWLGDISDEGLGYDTFLEMKDKGKV